MTHSTQSFDALVDLTRTLRGEWDAPGIRDAIRKALARDEQPTFAELAYALIRLAENPTIGLPAVLPLDGPHWRPLKREPEPQRAITCPKCLDTHMPWVECLRERPLQAPTPDEEPEMSRREIKMHAWATRARAAVAEADKSALAAREERPEPDAEALAAEKARRHARARHVLDERRREEA